jgi:hypothetical protein
MENVPVQELQSMVPAFLLFYPTGDKQWIGPAKAWTSFDK